MQKAGGLQKPPVLIGGFEMAVLTVIHNTTEQTINAQIGGTVLAALQAASITAPEAPCGGNGTCKK